MRQSEQKRRRKLHIVLRNLTGTQLSRKYRLRVFNSPQPMRAILHRNRVRNIEVKTLFGSMVEPPMAVLFQDDSRRCPESIVCIYILNTKREEVPG